MMRQVVGIGLIGILMLRGILLDFVVVGISRGRQTAHAKGLNKVKMKQERGNSQGFVQDMEPHELIKLYMNIGLFAMRI